MDLEQKIKTTSELKRKITLANQERADLIVKNAKIVNVFSGEIHKGNVTISDGIFIGLRVDEEGKEEEEEYDASTVFDAQGRIMCPGLIDGHIHIESSFLSPAEFCNVVARHGTSAVICDPHEITNVLGRQGINYILQSTQDLPVKVYLMMPSCVPATDMETSGATILANDISYYLRNYRDRVIGLAEMMNYPGIISGDSRTLSKLVAAGDKPKDGHARLLLGKLLDAYIIAGIKSDHECSNIHEAREKLRKGMHIMIRERTHEKNLKDLTPLVNEYNSSRFSLVSDDRNPIDLKENGHLDHLIRMAISCGIPPLRAIQMATINTANYYGLKDYGAIAIGFKADFILLDDLESFTISEVFLGGKRVVVNSANLDNNMTNTGSIKHGTNYVSIEKANYSSLTTSTKNTMHTKPINDPNIFAVVTEQNKRLLQVISIIPGQIITEKRIEPAKIHNGYAVADEQRDLAKLAVIERHHMTGNVGLGFVQGLGINRGAMASSVAHDSHNLVIAGMNDVDMMIAARHISSIGGGLAVSDGGTVIATLSLPIAGLMSEKPVESVIVELRLLHKACKKLGNVVKNPFMLLSFLALPVVPSLKLTDKGLVDVKKSQFTKLWVE
jgi:adenine deaminase